MATRLRIADATSKLIRNEFFEIEVDALTGGLKAIRDHKTRVNRLGQRLIFNPGSRMVAGDIQVTSNRSGARGNHVRGRVARRAGSSVGDFQAAPARVAGPAAA